MLRQWRPHEPRDDVDWGPQSRGWLDSAIFSRLAGPGMLPAEAAVTTVAMLGGVAHAWACRRPGWSAAQLGGALCFAAVNVSAAVQCTTATNKRWCVYVALGESLQGRGGGRVAGLRTWVACFGQVAE